MSITRRHLFKLLGALPISLAMQRVPAASSETVGGLALKTKHRWIPMTRYKFAGSRFFAPACRKSVREDEQA